MSLFPFMNEIDEQIADQQEAIPCEYDYDFDNNKMKDNLVYGVDAIRVWVYKTLMTKRYRHLIYSWDYGFELEDLIGKGYEKDYLESELQRYVSECLLINPHILSVGDFTIGFDRDRLTYNFTVNTKYGEVIING